MSTQVFLRSTTFSANSHRSNRTNNLRGTATGWVPKLAHTQRDTSATSATATATVTGPTAGVELLSSGSDCLEWLSDPIDRDVMIQGTMTLNVWASENSMNANVGIGVRIERVDHLGAIQQQVLKTNGPSELGTSLAVNNWTGIPPAGVAFNKGDRLRVTLFGIDVGGTMASGFTFTASFGSPSAGVSGDTYITFAENFGFLLQPFGEAPFGFVDKTDILGGIKTNAASGTSFPVTTTQSVGPAPTTGMQVLVAFACDTSAGSVSASDNSGVGGSWNTFQIIDATFGTLNLCQKQLGS